MKTAIGAIHRQAACGYDIALSIATVEFDARRREGTAALLAAAMHSARHSVRQASANPKGCSQATGLSPGPCSCLY